MDSTPTGRAVLDKRKTVLSLASGAAALATTTDSNPLTALQQLCRSVPVVDLVNLLAVTAAQCHASDVHIEPRHDHVAVRYRLDGLLTGITHLPKWMDAALTSRVKVLAGMDIADKRRPQDGRLAIKGESGDIVFRVSTLPTQYGEKVVMRLLHEHTVVPALDSLGLSDGNLARLKGLLRHHHGMILVVGPTGSGKTTTLASALSSLQSGEMNIITLEDPIEYPLPCVNQTQINDKADLTFAAALRAALRQDPDVIMLGEIRDGETAKTAMWASQTGHLVLSTLHTNDAPSAVTRLMDMGVESYTISSTLLGVVAQRLVRKLCLHCRKPSTSSARLLADFGLDEAEIAGAKIFGPGGCPHCHYTGYRGRVGIYEILVTTRALRSRIVQGIRDDDGMREVALDEGMVGMPEDGLSKVMLGITSVEELLRVVNRPRSPRRSNGSTCAMTDSLPPQHESHELLRLEQGRNGQRHDIR
jgi:type II secretory ATPase GspE/PulE/Tfp pilus assembly ATPase PilB-like protein